MNYSFKNIYSKAKVAVETDRYVIYQTLKSKLNFSGNYLLMKKEAETIETFSVIKVLILFILLPQKILVFLKNLINI